MDLLLPMAQWTERISPPKPEPVQQSQAEAEVGAIWAEAVTAPSEAKTESRRHRAEHEEEVLVAMPVFGTAVDSPGQAAEAGQR